MFQQSKYLFRNSKFWTIGNRPTQEVRKLKKKFFEHGNTIF